MRVIFYSWQSDSDERFNRYFIEDCLKRAIRKLHRDDLSDLMIDRDTKDVPGFIDIGRTILEKIDKAAMVVADLTLINPSGIRRPDERPVSNPNVLFELGYAYGKLGPKAIIGVFNTESGDVEALPFDIRPKRLMTYTLSPECDKAAVRAGLVEALAGAIVQGLGETEAELIELNSKIYRLLTEIWLFGLEIDDWFGIPNLPNVISAQEKNARELSDLVTARGLPPVARGLAGNITEDYRRASSLVLNEENWPQIKRLIAEAAGDAALIQHQVGFKPSPEETDKDMQWIVELSAKLDEHIKSIELDSYQRSEFEILSVESKKRTFREIMPAHHQFSVRLEQISRDMRRAVLSWAKADPGKQAKIEAIRAMSLAVKELVAKYCS